MVLNALVEKLVETGVLQRDDARKVRDLFTLSSILEGKSKRLFDAEEQVYLENVRYYLEQGMWGQVQYAEPPENLKHFHSILLRSLPELKKVKSPQGTVS